MGSGSSKAYISKRKVAFLHSKKAAAAAASESIPEEKGEEEEQYYSDVEVDEDDLDQFAANDGAVGAPKSGKKEEEKAKKHKKKGRKHRQEVDTNVVSIKAEKFNEPVVYATGDPLPCAGCKAIFNSFSRVVPEGTDKFWICEFCGHKNAVTLELEEYPKLSYMAYLLEGKAPAAAETGKTTTTVPPTDSDTSVVFCIDLSGSMDATQHYTGPKLKYMNAPSYITRLQCVKIAIDSQLEKMQASGELQKQKVGFVTFENDVILYGDRVMPPKTYSGAALGNYSSLLEDAINQAPQYMSKSLKDSYPFLLNTLKTMRTGGATALGPALLISVALAAQGKPGSKVLICTDGLANKGLGSLDEKKEAADEFYNQVAGYAKTKGVTVSLITLVEEGCRLDLLSPIANLTEGNIVRVNPMNLGKDFDAVVSEKVIATNVDVKIIIHKALQFRNEDERYLSQNKTILTKDVGNATKETVITFEYSVKPPKELMAMPDVDLEKLKTVPLQSQITYKDTEGRKCMRVLTQAQEVTNEKEEAIKGANKEVLGEHIAAKSAELAEKGDFRQAQANAFNFAQLAGNDMEVNQKMMPLYQALEKEQLSNEANNIEIPQEKSDRLAEAINCAKRQKHK